MTRDQIIAALHEVKAAYPRAWSKAHREGDPERYDFIILAGKRLHTESGGRVGCNWKRADIGDLSMDAITVIGRDIDLDDDRYYAVDVVVGASGDNPQIGWTFLGLLTDRAGVYAPHGFADPRELRTHYDYGGTPVPHACRLGCSLFWAPAGYRTHRARLDANLHWIKHTLGADYVRVIWKKGDPRSTTSPWYPHLIDTLDTLTPAFIGSVLDHIASFGLKTEITIFGDYEYCDDAQQDQIVRHFIEAARGREALIEHWEIFNEPYISGGGHGGESSTLRRHGRRLRGAFPDARIALGTPPVHAGISLDETYRAVEQMYGGDAGGANMITVHFDRSVNRPPDLGPIAPADRTNNEPRGPYSSNAETHDPATIAGDYAATIAADYRGYVYHPDPGIWSDLINPIHLSGVNGAWVNVWDVPNSEAIARVLRELRATGRSGPIEPGPGPGGDDVKPYPSEHDWWPAYEAEVAALYHRAHAAGLRDSPEPDWAAMRWFSRMGHSSAHDDLAKARAKHLAELQAALGL
jgi:hypothetical protein